MNQDQAGNAWGRIVAKAWSDDNFKKRLFANPTSVLKEHGLEVEPGIQVKIVEDTETLHHLNFPPRPSEAELSEEELEMVAGGISWTRWLCFGCQKSKGPTTVNFECEKKLA